MNLGIGSYSVAVALHSDDNHISANYEWKDNAMVFSVVNSSKKDFVGVVWLEQKVEVNYVK